MGGYLGGVVGMYCPLDRIQSRQRDTQLKYTEVSRLNSIMYLGNIAWLFRDLFSK